jgi:hypothetical protein
VFIYFAVQIVITYNESIGVFHPSPLRRAAIPLTGCPRIASPPDLINMSIWSQCKDCAHIYTHTHDETKMQQGAFAIANAQTLGARAQGQPTRSSASRPGPWQCEPI